MSIKANRSRDKAIAPPLQRPRGRSKRRSSGGTRNQHGFHVRTHPAGRARIDLVQWLAFAAVGLISLTLLVLIWTLIGRAINDEALVLRTRTDREVTSVAFVLAREIQDELQMVDQSLAIIQDAWNKDAAAVDLGAWRKQSRALTEVDNDIFIANEHGIIVQGTLPQSIGQGFGSAYVTYPNGSLETFDPDGTTNPDGKLPGADGVRARQFLTYLLRPLGRPDGWVIGASFRSEGITKLLSGAKLGQTGIIGLVALKRGNLQAIAGQSAQFANMDLAASQLIEQMRKNDDGVWAGVSPIDTVPRIFAFRHIPNRDMSVLVGVSLNAAMEPLAGLAATAHGLAALGSLVVLTIAGILIWTMATSRTARRRERARERAELNLTHAREELAVAWARGLLSEREADALIGSATAGVGRLDTLLQLRRWNARFAELAGAALNTGMPAEELFRHQAAAGLFGDAAASEPAIATRLTLLHDVTGSAEPPLQNGPDGEPLRLLIRGVTGGGHLLLLTWAEHASPEAVPDAGETDASQEATEW
jgi:hypothetical protein